MPADAFQDITPDLRAYALSLTRDASRAEDLLQDTYLSMLAHQAGGGQPEQPKRYMMAIMHNLFIDRLRRRKAQSTALPLEDVEPEAPEASAQLRLTCRDTLRALERLPAHERDVLRRHALEGQSYARIARALDIPIGTVMSRIARARADLCTHMGVTSGLGLLEDH